MLEKKCQNVPETNGLLSLCLERPICLLSIPDLLNPLANCFRDLMECSTFFNLLSRT